MSCPLVSDVATEPTDMPGEVIPDALDDSLTFFDVAAQESVIAHKPLLNASRSTGY